ncbi:MAG: cytochrome P450 [Pseudomonadota bacterium]
MRTGDRKLNGNSFFPTLFVRRAMIEAYSYQDPYSAYRGLRQAGSIHWDTEFCGGAWLLPNYEDVLNVLRDTRFSVQRAGRWVNSTAPGAREELREFKRIFSRSLLFLDGAHHTRLRKVMNAGFKPTALIRLAPRIQGIVDRLLGQLAMRKQFDFMQEFARPLPALVIADMLAIDAMDQPDFIAWSDDIAHFIGSPTPSLDSAHRAQRSLVALNEYFRALLPARRLHLGDDLISDLIRAESTGGVITSKELLAQCCTLLFAGHETTRNLLGNGLFHLLRHPRLIQSLQKQPALLPSAIKELLRFDSPVQFTGRVLTVDMEMHGKQLRKGDLVIPLIGAANRDPKKFSAPDSLDITRNEGMHLSFGYGAHVCIGATLTSLEAEIAFTSLMRAFPDMRLATSTPEWGPNPVYRGLITLPVHAGQTTRPKGTHHNALARATQQRPAPSSTTAIFHIKA